MFPVGFKLLVKGSFVHLESPRKLPENEGRSKMKPMVNVISIGRNQWSIFDYLGISLRYQVNLEDEFILKIVIDHTCTTGIH